MSASDSRSAAATGTPPIRVDASKMPLASQTRPDAPGSWAMTPKESGRSAGAVSASGSSTSSMPVACARWRSSAFDWGSRSVSMTSADDADFEARRASSIASTTAVPSSSIDAFAMSRPARSATIVWKLMSASSLPWLISGWYGV